MSDAMPEPGVLHTEYSSLTALSPCLTSLWSFESRSSERDRPRVAVNRDGNHEFWLDRSDPLLNVMLPDTSISLMINEFRLFAGAPPTVFFQPRGGVPSLARRQLRGRPSEWLLAW
jgi:hypothetical protein